MGDKAEAYLRGESDPMDVHSSRDLYFEVLHKDPYGLDNESYDWSGEDKFVAWMLPAMLLGCIGVWVAQAMGVLGSVGVYAYAMFFTWIGIELIGKYIFSSAILRYNIRINYIRKLALRPWRKLKTYVIPLLLSGAFGLEHAATSAIAGVLIFFFMDILKTIFTEWNQVRRRSPLLKHSFLAWDRIEDRPYTLRYDILEDLFRFIVYLPFICIFGKASLLVMIPNLINEFGDGLAEPVGIRFGKHKYRCRSLYYKGKFWSGNFERSLEGSAMVFLVSIIVVAMYASYFSTPQFLVLLAAMPILMTLAEAVSPHTNDGPMLALVGCSTIWAVTSFV